jgi:haloalkane dehalogenase
VKVLRTPDERFAGLPGWPYETQYATTSDGLRVGYVDVGPRDAPVVLMLHGEPTWSYLYRHVIGVVSGAGLRAVAPYLVGFGRSDKPADVADYSYFGHVEWMRSALFDDLGLHDVTLLCQDWGGLIGLRLVAEHPERFARVVAANTGLPTGEARMPEVWERFRDSVLGAGELQVGRLVSGGCRTQMDDATRAAYDAPFPDGSYQAGAKAFPALVPNRPDDPAGEAQRAAWQSLQRFDRPFVCAFSDSDPITRGADVRMRQTIPGAAAQTHPVIEGAGHFLQEDAGEQLARVVVDLVRST